MCIEIYFNTHISAREAAKIKELNKFFNLSSRLYSPTRSTSRNEVFLGVERVVSR